MKYISLFNALQGQRESQERAEHLVAQEHQDLAEHSPASPADPVIAACQDFLLLLLLLRMV